MSTHKTSDGLEMFPLAGTNPIAFIMGRVSWKTATTP